MVYCRLDKWTLYLSNGILITRDYTNAITDTVPGPWEPGGAGCTPGIFYETKKLLKMCRIGSN